MLTLPDTSPRWIDLPQGVRVFARPAGSATRAAAMASATLRLAEFGVIAEEQRTPLLYAWFVQAMASVCILKWQGVAAPLTPENAEALMDVEGMMEVFAPAMLLPSEALAAEGNGSGPAPNGISAAGPDIAEAAAPGGPPAAPANTTTQPACPAR